MTVSFQANPIGTLQIPKRQIFSKHYKDCNVSLVRINSEKDLSALQKMAERWKSNLAKAFVINAGFYINDTSSERYDSFDFCVLTTQTKNLKKLKANKILGISQTSVPLSDNLYLDLLCVNPKYQVAKGSKRKYKNIGTTLLDAIKGRNDFIVTRSSSNAVPFYKKNGFQDRGSTSELFWEKE